MCVGCDPLDRGPGGAAGGGVVEAEVLATGGADVIAEGGDVGLPGVPDAVTATLPDFSILEWKGYDSPLKTQVVVAESGTGQWIAMVAETPDDTEPHVTVKEAQLGQLGAVPE